MYINEDIIDPAEAPTMAYPAKGGPSAAELSEALRVLAAKTQIDSVSLSARDTGLDRDGRTQALCLSLLRALAEP